MVSTIIQSLQIGLINQVVESGNYHRLLEVSLAYEFIHFNCLDVLFLEPLLDSPHNIRVNYG